MSETSGSSPNFHIDPREMPASDEVLKDVLDTITRVTAQFGVPDDLSQSRYIKEKQNARETLAYIDDPEGASATLIALGEQDKLDLIRDELDSILGLMGRQEDLAQIQTPSSSEKDFEDMYQEVRQSYAEKSTGEVKAKCFSLEIKNPNILYLAGYDSAVYEIDIYLDDLTAEDYPFFRRQAQVRILHEDPKISDELEIHEYPDGRLETSRNFNTGEKPLFKMPEEGESFKEFIAQAEQERESGAWDIRLLDVERLNMLLLAVSNGLGAK